MSNKPAAAIAKSNQVLELVLGKSELKPGAATRGDGPGASPWVRFETACGIALTMLELVVGVLVCGISDGATGPGRP